MEKSYKPQMTKRHMRNACWMLQILRICSNYCFSYKVKQPTTCTSVFCL